VIIGAIIAPITGLFLARRAMRPIDAAFATQRAFVADASHEMRTPLAVLRANAEMLIRVPDMSESDVRLEATNIIGEVDEIARLVDDLIFLAQADEGAPGLFDRTSIDVGDVIDAEVTAHQHRVTAAGMSMTVSAKPGVVVTGDAARLRQVVRLLIDNAILYGRPDGTITVSLDSDGDTAVIRVADTGLGIARDDLRRIFDRFYRASDARGHRSGGSGLGLAIAKSIVEAHAGTIAVESEPGAGTTFTVRIPRSPGSPNVVA
jgi:signal transduction histidine kinase